MQPKAPKQVDFVLRLLIRISATDPNMRVPLEVSRSGPKFFHGFSVEIEATFEVTVITSQDIDLKYHVRGSKGKLARTPNYKQPER